MIRELPVDGAAEQLLEHVREHGEISSQRAGHLHQGASAALLLPGPVLQAIGRRWCRELAAAGVLAAGGRPDIWTLPNGTNL